MRTEPITACGEKRWQDVDEILAAGITVMTALNVQHLEGVQDIVRSATAIDIRERVPDRIVQHADSVILVDLPVAELQERLRQGKIYLPEQAARALENFFRTELLVRLRELALLQTATYSGAPVIVHGGAEVRLAVAVPFEPEIAQPLVLRGSRIAGRMNKRWYAVYVRQRRSHPENITAEQHRKLSENVQLAISLGATVVTRESEDVVGALLDFVRSEGISMLVVGRPTRNGLVSRVMPSTVHKLLGDNQRLASEEVCCVHRRRMGTAAAIDPREQFGDVRFFHVTVTAYHPIDPFAERRNMHPLLFPQMGNLLGHDRKEDDLSMEARSDKENSRRPVACVC